MKVPTIVTALLAVACAPEHPEVANLGDPLPGLGATELGRFQVGQAQFNRVFTEAEGVGPLFNENQCSACHTDPVSGGTGEQLILKASRFIPPDSCDPLREVGGENVRQRATPLLRAHGIEREPTPATATARGRFSVPFLFGLGLVEAIPEEAILDREDPQDRDGDGISGRAARLPDGRLGRFGRKADRATVMDFVDTALRFEMGLTTPTDPEERAMVGFVFTPAVDPAPDPEVDRIMMELLTDYIRFLAPPPRHVSPDSVARREAERGEELFHEIGCASCHVPSMRTGRNDIPALHRKQVNLYSDLLLHDMGPRLTDVCGPAARPEELRTEMLMGVGHRRSFLHDGRATSLYEAVLQHGGEASGARQAFEALGRVAQEWVIQFLRTL